MSKESNHSALSNAAIILAAGKGTRMHSDLPKVMHPIACKPMLGHVMDAASQSGCGRLVVVVSPDMSEVEDYARSVDESCGIAIQREQMGTAHAVRCAQEELEGHEGNLLVLFGDSPLIESTTLEDVQRTLAKDPRLGVVIVGFKTKRPASYGRLILSDEGVVERVVEAKDATKEELLIDWCNAGVMAIRGTIAWDMLEQVDNDNAQAEYYLPQVIEIARRMGYGCAVVNGSEEQALGVNSRADQARVEQMMQRRLRKAAMKGGVTMIDPNSVFLSADTEFGYDVIVEPNVFFGPNVAVGDGAEIRAFSHIEGAVIGDYATIGPFARIRPGSNIGTECKIGNFVELKKAQVEHGAKISHLSYIGDAHVGENANIGAGTITCNYDGYKKYHTEIGRDVFIGSNSALVAPIVIGEGAYVGAGSVVTENVEPDSLAVARSRQMTKDDWAKTFRERMEKK